MLYKLTSVKSIIAKVFSDLNLKEGDHKITDMVEWAGEALEKIGAFPSLTTKVTGRDQVPIIEFSNYQAKLPCDLHKLIQVAYAPAEEGPFYPMRYGTGSFDYGVIANVDDPDSSLTDTVVVASDVVNLAMDLYALSYEDALIKINSEPGTRSLLEGLLGGTPGETSRSTTFTTDYSYVITAGYLKTNIAEGYLLMSYQAIPTDADGYPMVPENESFFEALYWYINMKMMYPEWREGRVRDAVYYDARRSWNYYRKQAYGEAMMPSADQLESLKNTWLRLVEEVDEHSTYYSTVGEKQIIYNANA